MSQTFVSRTLKAPSTAEYPWMSSDGVTVTHEGACDYSVLAYLDAQNSFRGEAALPVLCRFKAQPC
jgi:hypothetical protein